MATIKSYTDLSQSKKLAEILPLESADGHWFNGFLGCTYRQEAKDLYDTTNNEYIPAWSLTALLGVLPSGYTIVKNYHDFYFVESRDHGKSTNIFNNPIDACYEMILKLNELKML